MSNPAKETTGSGTPFLVKLSGFIVDKRNLVFLIVIILLIFSAFSRNWVEVESDLTAYLPEHSETKKALTVMDDQFITYGSAEVMVANITPAQAAALSDQIADVKGVQMISYDETDKHYNNLSALYSITFDFDENDEACLDSLEAVKSLLASYDVYVKTDLGNTQEKTIEHEINVIMVYVAFVIVAVLLFTSETYGEVPVLIITFVVALVLNQGTNYLLGKISFVSNSVTSILQLALSIDYAIIFCNRFKEEHKLLPIREAVIIALSKSIPEIGASSLFGPLIDKTSHKSFVPKISFVGKIDYATRHVVPIIFIALLLVGFRMSKNCPFVYGYSLLEPPKLNETQIAEQMIEDNFTQTNLLALIVPAGDYDKEKELLAELERYDEVDSTMGMTNIEAMDGYCLADKLRPRQFAELANLDYELAQVVYAAYAVEHDEFGRFAGNISNYQVPLIDMLLYVCDQLDAGVVTLDDEQMQMLSDAKVQMLSAKNQLQGTQYSRMLLYLNLPVSGDETYAFTDTIMDIAKSYYPDGNVYLAGNSTNEYDFEKSFSIDNTVVSIVSVLIVLFVLLFTFNSAGMPLLLILVIQGSIWINFSFPTVTGKYLFFLGYLIVSSIQMGANIDYAIVIASRYQELKAKKHHREAMIETLNFAFPTIITSGAIMSICGFLIGNMTSEPVIAGIGESLGRGTVISIFLVMFVLPQILLIGSGVVDKTSFSVPGISMGERRTSSGRIVINGMVNGRINGNIHGVLRATVEGDVDVSLISGSAEEASSDEE